MGWDIGAWLFVPRVAEGSEFRLEFGVRDNGLRRWVFTKDRRHPGARSAFGKVIVDFYHFARIAFEVVHLGFTRLPVDQHLACPPPPDAHRRCEPRARGNACP